MSKSRDIADSAATINYIDTVTSNVQDQIDNIDPLPSQAGNNGLFLTTDGSTASWAEAGGGAWELISTTTASAASTVNITGIDSTYDQYVITGTFNTTQANWIMAQFFLGGSIVTTSTYDFVRSSHSSSGSFGTSQGTNQADGECMFAYGGAGANESESFVMYIFDPNTASVARKIYTEHFGTNGILVSRTNSTISNAGTSALTGIRIFNDGAGQTISGNFYLYGIKNS